MGTFLDTIETVYYLFAYSVNLQDFSFLNNGYGKRLLYPNPYSLLKSDFNDCSFRFCLNSKSKKMNILTFVIFIHFLLSFDSLFKFLFLFRFHPSEVFCYYYSNLIHRGYINQYRVIVFNTSCTTPEYTSKRVNC